MMRAPSPPAEAPPPKRLTLHVHVRPDGRALLLVDGLAVATFADAPTAHAFSLYPEALFLVRRLVDALQVASGAGPLDWAHIGDSLHAGRAFLQAAHLRAMGVVPPAVTWLN